MAALAAEGWQCSLQKGRCRASSWESRAEELFFIGMGLRQVVGGEVDRIEIEIEKVGAVGEVKGSGRRAEAGALMEDIFDVLAGEGLAFDGVLEGEGDLFRAMDVGEGDDLVDVHAGLEIAGAELLVVVLGLWAEGVEAQEPGGVAGVASLVEEFLEVIGVLEVAAAFVAPRMGGHQGVGVVEADPVGESLESQLLGGVNERHGVAVGVHDHPTAVGDAHQPGDRRVGLFGRQRSQGRLFRGLKEVEGTLMRFAVQTHVGHGVHPLARGDIEGAQTVGKFQSGQEVLLYVTDKVFDPAFLIGLAHIAGPGFKAVMSCKVEVTRIEDCLLALKVA